MIPLSRRLTVCAALLVCACKGAWALLTGGNADMAKRRANSWGWNAPEMRTTWLEQDTRPRGGWTHHRTDLLVEWVRLDAQRAAKLLSAFAALSALIGFAAGWFLTEIWYWI